MYPNLYYIFKDWFGVEWGGLKILNTFGLMVAASFVVAAFVLSAEMKRKEKQGFLYPREETIVVGKPASLLELVINFLIGFMLGFKLIGFFFNNEEIPAQEYIFSGHGSFPGGLTLGIVLAVVKWYEKNKQRLKSPEHRTVRIWPHDRVGDIIIIGLVSGILGAKLFDNFENWNDFIQHPVERLFSASGLTFYGGLILATICILWYAKLKNIKLVHLVDAAAPALMIAYAVGRIGCQVSGDGDWGIYNSAYITDVSGKVVMADSSTYQRQLEKYNSYFLRGSIIDSTGHEAFVTDRVSASLKDVPSVSHRAPSFFPVWFYAYNYPQNVNKDGIPIRGCLDEHNKVLPVPVYPTSLYETISCGLMFLLMWRLRKRIKTPGVMFAFYLLLNGLERFFIEKIRVNAKYDILNMQLSQAEIIAALLMLAGVVLYIVAKNSYRSHSTLVD